MSKKTLILSLIRDDLIHLKLVLGLNNMGFNADGYTQHLNEIIFKLMGFREKEQTEELLCFYLDLASAVQFINVQDSHNNLAPLVQDIYNKLYRYRRRENDTAAGVLSA